MDLLGHTNFSLLWMSGRGKRPQIINSGVSFWFFLEQRAFVVYRKHRIPQRVHQDATNVQSILWRYEVPSQRHRQVTTDHLPDTGGHDNGYQGPLATLRTLGFTEKKLVILQSYAQTAREIGMLHLPRIEIPGLFMANKLDKRFGLKKARLTGEPLVSPDTTVPGLSTPPDSTQKRSSNSQSKPLKKKVKAMVPPVVGASDSAEVGSPVNTSRFML